MESFVKDSIIIHIRAENLLLLKQHGFLNGRSIATQILSYLDRCIDTIVSGGVVDKIYFNFAKAFDSVPKARLLGKLKSYGINGKVLDRIKAFLSHQIVNFNGMKSDQATVSNGIPQSSVLEHILFVKYVNDLPEVVKCGTYLSADDDKLF